MAILKFSELHAERRTVEDFRADPPEIKRYRGFLVVTDDKSDGPDEVRAAADPRGTPHPNDPNCLLLKRSPIPIDDSPLAWRCLYEYSTNLRELEEGEGEDPLSLRAKITQGTRYATVPHLFDAVSGEPLLNAAGDPFDPPQMKEMSIPTINITKNFATRPLFLEDFRNTVNDADLTVAGRTYPAGTFRLRGFSVDDEHLHNVFPYFKAAVEFEIDPSGFETVVLNDGLNQLVGGDATKKEPIMIAGEPASRPVPLLANGAVVPVADLPGAATTITAKRYLPANYLTLELPT